MLEIIVDIETTNPRLTPIQVMICYHPDGTIYSVDWRETLITILEDHEDSEYLPPIDSDTDDTLEYNSDSE